MGREVYDACDGVGFYHPEASDFEMPAEGIRVLVAEAMHGWTLEYTDDLELRDRLEVLTVLNARTAAHNSLLAKDS